MPPQSLLLLTWPPSVSRCDCEGEGEGEGEGDDDDDDNDDDDDDDGGIFVILFCSLNTFAAFTQDVKM